MFRVPYAINFYVPLEVPFDPLKKPRDKEKFSQYESKFTLYDYGTPQPYDSFKMPDEINAKSNWLFSNLPLSVSQVTRRPGITVDTMNISQVELKLTYFKNRNDDETLITLRTYLESDSQSEHGLWTHIRDVCW